MMGHRGARSLENLAKDDMIPPEVRSQAEANIARLSEVSEMRSFSGTPLHYFDRKIEGSIGSPKTSSSEVSSESLLKIPNSILPSPKMCKYLNSKPSYRSYNFDYSKRELSESQKKLNREFEELQAKMFLPQTATPTEDKTLSDFVPTSITFDMASSPSSSCHTVSKNSSSTLRSPSNHTSSTISENEHTQEIIATLSQTGKVSVF